MTLFSRINRYFSSPHLNDEQLLEELIPKGKRPGRHTRTAHLNKFIDDNLKSCMAQLNKFIAYKNHGPKTW